MDAHVFSDRSLVMISFKFSASGSLPVIFISLLPPPEINHFTHLTPPYSPLMHLTPPLLLPYSPLMHLAPPLLPPPKKGRTACIILLTRDTLSPCKSIAAPWKLTCSAHFWLFSVQIYRCSVQNRLLHTNTRSFSVQKLGFSVENSMLLRPNRMLLRGKFDISPYKSKASAWKIQCFSVQIESFPVQNSMLLRGKLHSELGDLGSPPANKSLKLCFGGEKLCCL